MGSSGRALTGIVAILVLIAAWGAIIATFAGTISAWPVLLQAAFYLVTGMIWIVPLGPLLRWIATGRFRKQPPESL